MPRTCKLRNPLKTTLVLALCLLGAPAFGQSDQEVPSGFKLDRYQNVWQRNPFTLVAPVVAQAQPSLFDKLILLSWLHDGGNDVVFVQNTETNAVQKVTRQANAEDLKLVEVHADPDPRKAEVILSHGAGQGIVKFRAENPVVAAPAPVPVAPPGGQTPAAASGPQPLPGAEVQIQGNQNTLEAFQRAARNGTVPSPQEGVPNQVDRSVRPPRASEIRRKRVTAPPVKEQGVNPQQAFPNPANQPQGP